MPNDLATHEKECAERYEKFSVAITKIEEQLRTLYKQQQQHQFAQKEQEEKIYKKINVMQIILIAVASAVIMFHPRVGDIIKLFL